MLALRARADAAHVADHHAAAEAVPVVLRFTRKPLALLIVAPVAAGQRAAIARDRVGQGDRRPAGRGAGMVVDDAEDADRVRAQVAGVARQRRIVGVGQPEAGRNKTYPLPRGAGSREQGAGSREQGAGSREQGAGSREQGAEGNHK